jgi:hypothetical protein
VHGGPRLVRVGVDVEEADVAEVRGLGDQGVQRLAQAAQHGERHAADADDQRGKQDAVVVGARPRRRRWLRRRRLIPRPADPAGQPF